MIRRFMLDTNMVSYIAKGKSEAARLRMQNRHFDEVVCISSVSEGEIRFGLAKNPTATALRFVMERFLNSVDILPWGREEAAVYGLLRARQEAEGKPMTALDTLIAAHAAATSSTLVTHDKAFLHVQELSAVVDWATDL